MKFEEFIITRLSLLLMLPINTKTADRLVEISERFVNNYVADGSAASGNWGHESVKGKRGGSAPGGGKANRISRAKGEYTSKAKESKRSVVSGTDITGSFSWDTGNYKHVINAALAAQGFDGLPKVVSSDEFDDAVNASSFIAQRTYSASSQEILDEYRKQLYDTDFYVDCGTGGAQYGQGMYCAADYNGKLTYGIETEMMTYKDIGTERTVYEAYDNYAETLTADTLNKSVFLEDNPLTQEEADLYISTATGQRSYSEFNEAEQELRTSMVLSGKWNNAKEAYYDEMENFANNYTGYSYTETLTLDPSAKIVSYTDIVNEVSEYKETYATNLKNQMIEEAASEYGDKADAVATIMKFNISEGTSWNEVTKAYDVVGDELYNTIYDQSREIQTKAYESAKQIDVGTYAALKGYDAINASGHGASGSYTVILNRTKMIIKEPDGYDGRNK